MKQCQGDEINNCGAMDFIDIDLIIAEVQLGEEFPTTVETTHRLKQRLQYH